MTREQQELAWKLINDPPEGSKLAEAKEYGVDLTLLAANLRLTVSERLQNLYAVAAFYEKLRNSGVNSQR